MVSYWTLVVANNPTLVQMSSSRRSRGNSGPHIPEFYTAGGPGPGKGQKFIVCSCHYTTQLMPSYLRALYSFAQHRKAKEQVNLG